MDYLLTILLQFLIAKESSLFFHLWELPMATLIYLSIWPLQDLQAIIYKEKRLLHVQCDISEKGIEVECPHLLFFISFENLL